MKKNNWYNRKHQALNTRYNVYYNANESFKKGYNKVEESFAPDYSHVIDVYAVSDKSTAGVAKGDMARTIEKCELAIQERSMQKKPKKKYEKMRDPNYVAFYNQEEFNSYMDEVWMLLGKAKFYSNDYLAASATFTYVTKHFSSDKNLVFQANIWKARALKEMDWIYEADEILKKIDPEELIGPTLNLYHGAMADLLLTQHEYEDALPHLLKAAESEKIRMQRTRYYFVAAQIYQLLGKKEDAFAMYEKVMKANPPYQMAFNARIRQTEVFTGQSSAELIAKLEKMGKNHNNEDYLDQIYYAIGNIYMAQKDTVHAIQNYRLSLEKSTRHGLEKAQTLITLGDFYYGKCEYVLAQPCFSEASSIIDHKHDDYQRVSKLASVLDELVQNYNTYVLRDSLLKLSVSSKAEVSEAISRSINLLLEEEKKERERLEKEKEEQDKLELQIENMAVMDQRALGTTQTSTWYFYNKNTVDVGKLEFRKRFGQRRLEDNWNRKNKNIMVFSEDAMASVNEQDFFENSESNDSIKTDKNSGVSAENDPKRPEYYLRQIPFTDEQKTLVNTQIADALFEMGMIYDEKLQDYKKSLETYEEFIRRYPNDPRAADAYYCCYRIGGKMENASLSDSYRDRLVAEYPDSKYAKILSQPDFRKKLEDMWVMQDSLYALTYANFLSGNFAQVKINTSYMEANYPVSSLMPKFLLLNALSIGKTDSKEKLAEALNDLLTRYPTSDVSSMVKDILALINSGKDPVEGTKPAGLMALREEVRKETAVEMGVVSDKGFTVSYDSPYLFKIITDTLKVNQNKLLYETAMYNFTKFLIKDFDLNVKLGVLTVSGLDNYEEALWYINGVFEDKGIQSLLKGTQYKYLLITPENDELLGKGYTLEQYEKFYKEKIAGGHRGNKSIKVELVGEQTEIEKIKSEQKLNVREGDNLNGAQVSLPSENKPETKESVQQESTKEVKAEQTVLDTTKVTDNKQQSQHQLNVDTTSVDSPKMEKVAVSEPKEQPQKKELKKYKGLYTYDEEAPHYFVILVNEGAADVKAVESAINAYNQSNHPLLNLSVKADSASAFSQMFVVGVLPSVEVAMSYMRQEVKSYDIKDAFGKTAYRNIVISEENLKALKSSGNINVYMELFKKVYLNR